MGSYSGNIAYSIVPGNGSVWRYPHEKDENFFNNISERYISGDDIASLSCILQYGYRVGIRQAEVADESDRQL
jgi:hypothetical protein